MGYLSQRLHLKVAVRQTLTPSVIQMVKLLQLARPELRDYITNELAENPMLEEAAGEAEDCVARLRGLDLPPAAERERALRTGFPRAE